MSGRGRHGTFDVGDKPTRPEDPEVRRANLRRVFRLFGPERSRLSLVLALIVFSSALGMVPAFLLRDVIDNAIPTNNTTLLAWLALCGRPTQSAEL